MPIAFSIILMLSFTGSSTKEKRDSSAKSAPIRHHWERNTVQHWTRLRRETGIYKRGDIDRRKRQERYDSHFVSGKYAML